MNPSSEDFKDMLEDASIGTFGTDLFISSMPNTPDTCIALFDTGGYAPEAGYTYQRPTVQIRVRGEMFGYQNAYDLIAGICSELHGIHNETWNSTRYVGIWQQSDIMFLEYDEINRPLFSVNFRIHRTD